MCTVQVEDGKALDLIKDFGTEFQRHGHEIQKACELTSGLSDVIVILERPAFGHNYALKFADFVRGSKTLDAVDQLIRLASKDIRNIQNVTVLDAFPFKPLNERSIPAARCHDLIAKILELKRPRIVICCWQGLCDHPLLATVRSAGIGSWPLLDQVNMNSNTSLLIRSFHPATAVWYHRHKPSLRMLLISHFAVAFAMLSGLPVVPDWIKEIGKTGRRDCRQVSSYFVTENRLTFNERGD